MPHSVLHRMGSSVSAIQVVTTAFADLCAMAVAHHSGKVVSL